MSHRASFDCISPERWLAGVVLLVVADIDVSHDGGVDSTVALGCQGPVTMEQPPNIGEPCYWAESKHALPIT
jgi:hypothetical protein